MGMDAGFDMVPRLSRGIVDMQNWNSFIDIIKENYKDDPQVEVKPNYIVFKAGEHPMLPFEGHKFLRFSSKISGRIASETRVESYIDAITRAARARFGSRIQYWNEYGDQYGYYDWNEVHESTRSYEQPDEPETSTIIAHALTGIDPCRELGIPLFEVKDIPGKGRGLFARVNISKGTQILCEKPLLTAGPVPPNKLEPMLAAKLKAMPKTSQRQFLSLHNNFPGKYAFSGIVKTNALPCGPGSPVGGVYTTICLINHSCLPNCHNNWDSNREHETIYAIRPIKAGEEITIPYDHGGPATTRRAFLKSAFGFDCECSICTLPPAELQASDVRRLLIQRLDDAIGDPFRMETSPRESLKDCHSLLQALEEEFEGHTGAHSARLYYDAFQVCIAHGDQARASVFAEKAYKARVVCEGEESPETKRVKSLSLKPADHGSFGLCSTKWKTTRNMSPWRLLPPHQVLVSWPSQTRFNAPFSILARGDVTVAFYIRVDHDPEAYGLDLISPTIPPDTFTGFPVAEGTVLTTKRGYGSIYGWTQLWKQDFDTDDWKFDWAPIQKDSSWLFVWFGPQAQLFDGLTRVGVADLDWTARSFLTYIEDSLMTRSLLETTLGSMDWDMHVAYLSKTFPDWKFSYSQQ
ncbi:hypothetical protein VMCG_05980 [Cytospora schulzeri]|uniref:SET domain-containing protein n=1 Tax=Cytospora schulzeri TaxID=448051 RepID=A0A423WDB5_9PEZI|nr:hypothetical protein VMCG_05980 [Valsa malicola]